MDKEKLVKEIGQVIFEHYHNGNIAINKSLAEKIYDKITEDEVVISKEEYEKLKILKEGHITCEDLLEFVKQARKETVEKILNELWNHKFETTVTIQNNCSKEDAENICKAIIISIRNKIEELAKQFGVEIGGK